jgi:ABC-type glycerol-3-phosphate transport system permease component
MSVQATGRRSALEGAPARVASRPAVRIKGSRVLYYVVLSLIAIGTLVPFIAMVLLAITPPGGLRLPSLIPTEITFEHLQKALSAASIEQWIVNSLIYSVVTIVVSLFLASMAAYAFAKKKFKGRDTLFWAFVAMLMVPGQLTIVPLFILIAELHGIDTYWGLILPGLANAQAVFLLRQFIREIPDDLIEASKIDGASEWYIYSRIILPLTTPVLATLGVFIFSPSGMTSSGLCSSPRAMRCARSPSDSRPCSSNTPPPARSWPPPRSTSSLVSSSSSSCSVTSCRASA